MNKTVMILGATGNFGSKIADSLVSSAISLILVGRSIENLRRLKAKLKRYNHSAEIDIIECDINQDLATHLLKFKPFIVINTCGPFQEADYRVAITCIKLSIHYIDLADSRSFVGGFSAALNELAIMHHCIAITGASTVPCLSSAVLDYYKPEFNNFDSLIFGISPGQKTTRGLATTRSILNYLGKPLAPYAGFNKSYGWQDLYKQSYPIIGNRWMANCDIADLDLLPKYYHLNSIKFSAGMESTLLHFSIFFLSWLVRIGLIKNPRAYAPILLRLSNLFNYLGSKDGGMHMIMCGQDRNNQPLTIKWFIIARNGDGPHIPTIPAIVLTKKLLQNKLQFYSAMPCMKLVTLEEYLDELKKYSVKVYESKHNY